MEYQGSFDFFYGKESERLNFITIPKLLLKDERFKNVYCKSKIQKVAAPFCKIGRAHV